MEIVGALRVYAFVDGKVFPVFLVYKGIAAVGTAKGMLPGETVVIRGEVGTADLAFDLSFLTIVPIEVRLRGIAGWTFAVLWDVTFFTAGNRFDFFVVFVFKVRDKGLPVPFILTVANTGEFVCFELLVFWGVGIVESPMFQRDIFADKEDKPAILLVKRLNYREQIGNNIHKQ